MTTRMSLLVLVTLCWRWALLLSGGLAGVTSVFSKFLKHMREDKKKSASEPWWLFPSFFPAPVPTVQFDSSLSNATMNQSAVSVQSWHCHGVMRPWRLPTAYDDSIHQGLWFRKFERLVQAPPTLATCCIIQLLTLFTVNPTEFDSRLSFLEIKLPQPGIHPMQDVAIWVDVDERSNREGRCWSWWRFAEHGTCWRIEWAKCSFQSLV